MMSPGGVGFRSVEALVRAVRFEADRFAVEHYDETLRTVVYLDSAATEVVRWVGGLRWAYRALKLAPGCLRSLEEEQQIEGDLCIVVSFGDSSFKTSARIRRVVLLRCAGDGDGEEEEDAALQARVGCECLVQRIALHIVAPLASLDEDDELPPIFTLASPLARAAFPVMPHERSGEEAALRADELSSARRSELKELARQLALAMEQLGFDARQRVWALGQTSSLLGLSVLNAMKKDEEEEGLFAGLRGEKLQKASLILIDRGCDLPTAVSRADSTLLTRALGGETRIEGALLEATVLLNPEWQGASLKKPPVAFPALRALEPNWPAAPSLSDSSSRRMLRQLATRTNDASLEVLAEHCRAAGEEAGRSPAPSKPGRGRGAELDAQLKALLAPPPRQIDDVAWRDDDSPAVAFRGCSSVAPLAALAIEATQRTSRKMKSSLEDVAGLEALQTRLVPAGAGLEELLGVLADALETKPSLKLADAQALALRAAHVCAAAGTPTSVGELTLERFRRAILRLGGDPDTAGRVGCFEGAATLGARALSSIGASGPLLPALAKTLLDRETVQGLTLVGGALESFGAAMGQAVGLGRLGRGLLKRVNVEKQPVDDDAVLVVFVVGGLATDELKHIALLLKDRKKVVFGATTIATADDFAQKVFGAPSHPS